jgi:guanylate kinase
MKNLYCIIGASGSGKTTIVNHLHNYGFKSISSYTTRPKRHEKETGHEFVNNKQFNKIRKDLCAYTLFNGFEYGATNKQVDINDLYIVDWAGFFDLKNNYKGKKEVISIFIDVPDHMRIFRMKARNDTDNMIYERLNNDKFMFNKVKEKCDYVVENSDLLNAVNDILNIISDEEIDV